MSRLREYVGGLHKLHLFRGPSLRTKPKRVRVGRSIDTKKVETALYLEMAMSTYYPLIIDLIHNGRVRWQCQSFLQESLLAQNQLTRLLKDPQASQARIEQQGRQHAGIDPLCLSTLGIMKVALETARQKMSAYQSLDFKKEVELTQHEIKFLSEEQDFQRDGDSNIIFS